MEILGLFQSSGSYKPEKEAEAGFSLSDLEMAYIREYFHKVYEREIEDFSLSPESMLQSLGILTSKGEVTRAGMLFFGRRPQQYEHSVVIKAVVFWKYRRWCSKSCCRML